MKNGANGLMQTDNNRAVLIGLCGRSGSGKGYVCQLFCQFGIPSVDTDLVYRRITEASIPLSPCMQELSDHFGPAVVNADGSLNRAAMREIVFGKDPAALSDLNRITHKHILEKTMEEAEELHRQGADYVIIDAPVLFESGFNSFCDCTVCVTAPEETLICRIKRRDGISEEDAKKRLASQKSEEELRSKTDYEIINDCDRVELLERIRTVCEDIRENYKKGNLKYRR